MSRVYFREPGGQLAWLDLSTARSWSDRDLVTNAGSRGAGRGIAVWRTPGGKWVREHWTDWGGEAPEWSAMSPDAAREWLLLNDFESAAAELFGAPEEAPAPGRPVIGGRVTVHIGDDLLARVDAARAREETRADAIRRLLEKGLST